VFFLIIEIQISKFRVCWNVSWRHEMPKPVRCPEVDVKIPARSACAHGSAQVSCVQEHVTQILRKTNLKMNSRKKIHCFIFFLRKFKIREFWLIYQQTKLWYFQDHKAYFYPWKWVKMTSDRSLLIMNNPDVLFAASFEYSKSCFSRHDLNQLRRLLE